MELAFGIFAIMAAIVSIALKIRGGDNKKYSYASVCLTALTMAFFYKDAVRRVVEKDISGLEDVVVPIANPLMFLVIASIVINTLAIVDFKKK
ncbi:hypothetical protein [Ezakiella peruensis]|uniref:hypothetical protein n=1 Tax=Ezakiella peruensis TaxID=1464038 RepID=UPI000C1B4FFA|nr:hypothetical protein [Ezakiella peruensis]